VPLKRLDIDGQLRSLVILFVALAAVSLSSQGNSRAQVKLAWDASPDPSVIGYVVRVGTASGQYTETYDVRKRRTFTYKKAIEGRRYFFAVSAYSDAGVLSPLSSEVSVVAVARKPRPAKPRPAKPRPPKHTLNQSAGSPANPSDRQ